MQREVMRNNLRELGVQEFTFKGLLSMGEKALLQHTFSVFEEHRSFL